MFSNSSCEGRLCPAKFEKIDEPGFADKITVIPYVEVKKGYKVGVISLGHPFLSEICSNKKPFDCIEGKLKASKIPIGKITHLYLIGEKRVENMLVFNKLEQESGDLRFVKVDPNMELDYSWFILYTLSSPVEKLFIKRGRDIGFHHILTELRGKDLINFCRVNEVQHREECEKYILPILEDIMGDEFIKTKIKVKWVDVYAILFEAKFDINDGMRIAAEGGRKDLIDFFIEKGANGWDLGMQGAAKGGHRKLVDFFISKGAEDWELGMQGAVEGGRRNVVDFFISKGAKDWEGGMLNAARIGRKDLVDLFISKGAEDWKIGLFGAARGGHKDLVDFFVEKGAKSWNWGMVAAAIGGHKDLVDFFIAKGANDWEWGMAEATNGGHKDLVEFFIEKGAHNWERGMQIAANKGHKELVDFFIEKGAHNWRAGMQGAAGGGHKDLVEFFIEKGARDWNLGKMSSGTNRELLNFFENKIAEENAAIEVVNVEREEVEENEERILPRMDWLEQ